MTFDAKKVRDGFLADDHGMLRWYLQRSEATTEGPLGSIAISDLHVVTRAWLTGLQNEVNPIVSRAMQWLDLAIDTQESAGSSPSFHQLNLRWARAIARWMQRAESPREDWAAMLHLEKTYWTEEKHPIGPHWIITHCLDDYMAFALQAGLYADGIETYERLVESQIVSPKKIRKPRDYAYALCLQQVQARFDEEELFAAGRRVLQTHLDDPWLGRGQSLRAATWLKIVYWDRDRLAGRQPALTPLQTVLKAYENMPGVAIPCFVNLDCM